jgi:hypothetical protein
MRRKGKSYGQPLYTLQTPYVTRAHVKAKTSVVE